jgi:hypothetical protein
LWQLNQDHIIFEIRLSLYEELLLETKANLMDIQAAMDFVARHGDPIEQARLHYLMTEAPASSQAADALLSGQRSDGGWEPGWAAYYSSLDATCFRLTQARQLGLGGDEPHIAQALRFLTERQNSEGSWEEDAAMAELAPPWAAPGELDARLYLTANCAYWLGLFNRRGEAAAQGSSFLLSHLEPEGRLPTFLHGHWLCAGLWTLLGKNRPAQTILTHLLGRLPGLNASSLAWMVTTLCDAGLPATHELIQKGLAKLNQQQQPEGRWSSEDGPARDVHATLEALLANKMAGKGRSVK